EVCGDVFANRRVRATPGLNGSNAFRLERLVADQELAILLCEDVIRDYRDVQARAQPATELEHQPGFAAADPSADSDSKGAPGEIAVDRPVAVMEVSGVIEMFV